MAQLSFQSPATSADDNETVAKQASLAQSWLTEIADARKREKDFREFGRKVTQLYEADKREEYQFNILFSNTETLAPALYNSVPRPIVQRRFKDADPLGKAASLLTQRVLEFLLDADMRDYPPFDDLMQSAVAEALVPGRGVTRFKYDATFTTVAEEENASGEALMEVDAYEKVAGELVCGEAVAWNRFLHGYATKWKDVPWVAFEWPMTKAELEKNFGAETAAKCELGDIEASTDDDSEPKGSAETSTKGAWVYEIWDKANRRVIFVSEGFKAGPLKEVDDPLGLSGFFPCPRPLAFLNRISSLTPVALYSFYEEQAKELNRVTVRINKLIAALKVRGFYDSTVEGLDKVMTADDNVLVPAENVAALQQGQTLEKAIFLMPIEKLISVLQQLYTQRQQVKQVIYEITGIADIMRGSTVASETLGAQQIKNQWGTLRLKKAQKEVMRYARDSLRIMAEIAVTKLSPETLKAMTGLPFPQQAEQAQAQAIAQEAVAVGQQPPQEIAAVLSQPTFEQLLALLRNDLQRSYRIDIETNSTVDAEATEDKQDMSELMNAMAQFMNGIAPAVQSGIMPFEAAKAMLLGLIRRFRFGADVEDLIKTMQPPAPPKPEEPAKPAGEPPEVVAAKAQSALSQEQMKQETLAMEAQFKREEHNFKMQELARKAQLAAAQHAQKMAAAMMPKPAGVTSA